MSPPYLVSVRDCTENKVQDFREPDVGKVSNGAQPIRGKEYSFYVYRSNNPGPVKKERGPLKHLKIPQRNDSTLKYFICHISQNDITEGDYDLRFIYGYLWFIYL